MNDITNILTLNSKVRKYSTMGVIAVNSTINTHDTIAPIQDGSLKQKQKQKKEEKNNIEIREIH